MKKITKNNFNINKKTFFIFEIIESLFLGIIISIFLTTMFLAYIGKVSVPIDLGIVKYIFTSLFFYLFFILFSISIFLFDIGKILLIEKK